MICNLYVWRQTLRPYNNTLYHQAARNNFAGVRLKEYVELLWILLPTIDDSSVVLLGKPLSTGFSTFRS